MVVVVVAGVAIVVLSTNCKTSVDIRSIYIRLTVWFALVCCLCVCVCMLTFSTVVGSGRVARAFSLQLDVACGSSFIGNGRRNDANERKRYFDLI